MPVVAVPSASFGLKVAGKEAAYHIYHLRRVDGKWQAEAEVRGLRGGVFRELARRAVAIPDYV